MYNTNLHFVSGWSSAVQLKLRLSRDSSAQSMSPQLAAIQAISANPLFDVTLAR